jgi:hypothetical protein
MPVEKETIQKWYKLEGAATYEYAQEEFSKNASKQER